MEERDSEKQDAGGSGMSRQVETKETYYVPVGGVRTPAEPLPAHITHCPTCGVAVNPSPDYRVRNIAYSGGDGYDFCDACWAVEYQKSNEEYPAQYAAEWVDEEQWL